MAILGTLGLVNSMFVDYKITSYLFLHSINPSDIKKRLNFENSIIPSKQPN